MRGAQDHFAAGTVAGMIAGVAMAAVAMVHAAYMGMSPWFPLQQIAAAYYGVDALLGGFGINALGLAVHLIVSATLGGFAGLCTARLGPGGALLAGIAAGIAIWAVMTFAVVPATNEVMAERIALTPEVWFACHLVFGGLLSLTPWLDRRLSHA